MNPALSTCFLHILQGQWSAVQVLIFVLSSFKRPRSFFGIGRGFYNLGTREESFSKPS